MQAQAPTTYCDMCLVATTSVLDLGAIRNGVTNYLVCQGCQELLTNNRGVTPPPQQESLIAPGAPRKRLQPSSSSVCCPIHDLTTRFPNVYSQ
jgi:hypothetical protein